MYRSTVAILRADPPPDNGPGPAIVDGAAGDPTESLSTTDPRAAAGTIADMLMDNILNKIWPRITAGAPFAAQARAAAALQELKSLFVDKIERRFQDRATFVESDAAEVMAEMAPELQRLAAVVKSGA